MPLELIRKKTRETGPSLDGGSVQEGDAEGCELPETEIYTRLSRLFNETFDEEIVLTPGTTAQDVEGWDSFAHINLVLAAESEFGVRFTSSDVERMLSVGDMVACILRRREQG